MRNRKMMLQRLAAAFVAEAERFVVACPSCATRMTQEDRQRYLDDARAFRDRLLPPAPAPDPVS